MVIISILIPAVTSVVARYARYAVHLKHRVRLLDVTFEILSD